MVFDSDNISYAPILSISPAELNALEELPEKTKDIICPIFLLKGWVGANHIQSSLERISKAFGLKRPLILDIDPNYGITKTPRPVHEEIRNLLNPNRGYLNWSNFLKLLDFESAIPCLQLHDLNQLTLQINNLKELNTDIAIRLLPNIHVPLTPLLEIISKAGISPIFILDYGQKKNDLLSLTASALADINVILAKFRDARIILSATTFPSSFDGVISQTIYERQFFNTVSAQLPLNELFYSDRGSARATRQNGGGGIPYPRIDYPVQNDWYFFREVIPELNDKKIGLSQEEKSELKFDGYVDMAEEAMTSECWKPDLAIWGTQMIQRTADGDPDAIISPSRSTAVRINIHMYLQSLYGHSIEEIQDADDDWPDDL